MIFTFCIIALVALAIYGIVNYVVKKKKDDDDF